MRQFKKEIEFDCFAGGGGTSCGAKKATGRSPKFALNHNSAALDMHKANHPETIHVLEDVYRRKPEELCEGYDIGLGLFSPDCRHFSLARGGRPTSPRVRALAWSVVWYAKKKPPRVFIVENVREFLSWGPMIHAKSESGAKLFVLVPEKRLKGTPFIKAWKKKTRGHGGTRTTFDRLNKRFKDGRTAKLTPAMIPNPKHKGRTFLAWTRALKREGYALEWRILDAADYGVPTHRKRLFVIGRNDGEPICWPEQTHASPAMIRERPLIFGSLKPYRTAAECIDFDLPTRSIFGRVNKKGEPNDLADKTQRRLAKGFMKFVVENPKPYIVRLGQTGGNGDYTNPTDEPLTTVTTKREHCLVSPTLIKVNHAGPDDRSSSVQEPIDCLTSKNGHALAGVSIVELAHGGGGTFDDGRSSTPEQPLGTVHAGGENHAVQKNHLAPVYLAQIGYGEREGQEPRALNFEEPLGTVVGTGKHAQVAVWLSRFFGGKAPEGLGRNVDEPCPTVTAIDHNALAGVSLVGVGGAERAGEPASIDKPSSTVLPKDSRALATASLAHVMTNTTAHPGSAVDSPLPTQTTGNHHYLGEAAVNVVKFRGDSAGSDANNPMPSVTSGQGAERPAGAAHALGMAAVYLARFENGDKQWSAIDEPLGVVTAQGNKFGLVYAWLMKYHGNAIGNPLDEPSHTIDGNDRYALVKVFVETSPGVREPAIMINVPGIGPCLVSDIHLRMLTPRELARCQSFPDSYILTGSKSSQVARIGNSVPPELMERLIRSNYKPARRPVNRPKRKAA